MKLSAHVLTPLLKYVKYRATLNRKQIRFTQVIKNSFQFHISFLLLDAYLSSSNEKGTDTLKQFAVYRSTTMHYKIWKFNKVIFPNY